MNKVDVIINVYGKPWQTLSTLKSLLKHSKQHIDKIFLIKEKQQPNNENVTWIYDYFDNLIVYEPNTYSFVSSSIDYKNENDRFKVRYQYGFEKSDKKFVFVTHNDVLYTGDIIGDMLNLIGENLSVGQIGQCWNCPAKSNNLCSGEIFNEVNISYDVLYTLSYPHVRTQISMIDKNNPKPLPECRMNEWSCLINREIVMKECKPLGDVSLFGEYGLDLGTKWFREMYLKGYKFIDYRKNFIHCFWSDSSGYDTQRNIDKYKKSELNAANYYNQNLN
jgi:hypothetical protein